MIRSGDNLFMFEGRPYLAAVGTLSDAAEAAHRLMDQARDLGVGAASTLVAEPYPPNMKRAIERVENGWVKIFPRREDDVWID